MRKSATLCLCLIGVSLIVWGGFRWWESHQLTKAGEQFLQAVVRGDAASAESWILRSDPGSVRLHSEGSPPKWRPMEGVRIILVRQTRTGNVAELEYRVTKEGFHLKPRLRMKRTSDGWRVVGIDHLQPDPRWEQEQREQQRFEDEQIADELIQKLGELDSPGR